MGVFRQGFGAVLAALSMVFFAVLVPPLYARPRPQESNEMQVALPRFVQVIMSAGDRFLAANLAGFRSLVYSTEDMSADSVRILGVVQSDVAWLNPAHEDNYYIAAAILPWYGEVEAAQRILKSASDARLFDWQPPFYYAFNAIHFQKDHAEGAEWLRRAARQTHDEAEILSFQELAARWASKGEDTDFAIRLHRSMAKETRHAAFAKFLEKRAQRLENLSLLEKAVDRYKSVTGVSPGSLQNLVALSLLPSLPADPFGGEYVLDREGKPQVVLMPGVAQ